MISQHEKMSKAKLDELANEIVPEIASDVADRWVKILTLLARGSPVAIPEISAAFGVPSNEAKSFLEQFGAEFDQDGNLLGLGLTLKPTAHSFEVEGKKLYAWCATDTLWFPLLLNKAALVETVDPVNGAKIRLSITPQGVEKVQPSGAVLSWSTNYDIRDVRGSFCAFGHWFSSGETASEYVSKHPGVIVLAAEDVREIGRIVLDRTRRG